MSIETRLRETGPRGGGGGGSSNSGGLAGTGGLFAVYSNNASAFPFSKILSAGNNITLTTDANAIFIAATTGGAGTGTVNPGSAGFLAYYPANGTTVDDSTISTSTGAGIAPFNFQTLTTQIVSPNTGDFWTLDSAGKYIYHYISGTAFYTRLTHTDGTVTASTAGLAGTGFYYIVGSSTPGLPNSRILTSGTNISLTTDATSMFISSFSGGLQGTGGLTLTAGTNISIVTDATAVYINAITGVAAASGGLASTGGLYIVHSASPLFPNSRILVGGSSTSVRTDGTSFYVDATTANALAFVVTSRIINTLYPLTGGGLNLSADRTFSVDTAFLVTSNRTISTTSPLGGGGNLGGDRTFTVGSLSSIGSANQFLRVNTNGTDWGYINFRSGSSTVLSQGSGFIQIDATTGASASSGGLAGTGGLFAVYSASPLLPNSRIITAGSSVTVTTDATAIYITAITPTVSASSAGLMGTGGFFVAWSSDTTMSNERVLTAGSSVTLVTDATTIWINALTGGGASTGNIGTGGFLQLPVQAAKLYGNDSSARIDAGTPVWRLLYSATTQQYGIWQFTLPFDYSGSPATQLIFSSDSSLSVAKSIQWNVDQWGFTNSQGNIYIDTFAGANSTTIALSAGYSAGLVNIITVPLATTTSFGAGNLIRLRVSSSAGGVTGNQELVGLGLFYRAGTQTIATGSAGLQGTGSLDIVYSSDTISQPNSKVLSGGTGVVVRTSATAVIIDAIDKDYPYYLNMRTNHILGAFASVDRSWYIAGLINASALGATIFGQNSAYCVPFVCERNIKVDSMGINITIAGSATTQTQLGIYTNSADECLFPFQSIATSAVTTSNALGIYAFNPLTVLSANNLYWLCFLMGRSGMTVRSLAVGGAYPILGIDSGMGTTPGIGYQIFMTTTAGLPSTMIGSGNVMTSAVPALGIRGSI